jgi:hypothetical protein
MGGNANFVIKLQANKPFTDKDTLFYSNYHFPINGQHRYLIGPFSNGILDSVKNWPLLGPVSYGDNNLEALYMAGSVGIRNPDAKLTSFKVDRCGKWGEVTIVIN